MKIEEIEKILGEALDEMFNGPIFTEQAISVAAYIMAKHIQMTITDPGEATEKVYRFHTVLAGMIREMGLPAPAPKVEIHREYYPLEISFGIDKAYLSEMGVSDSDTEKMMAEADRVYRQMATKMQTMKAYKEFCEKYGR